MKYPKLKNALFCRLIPYFLVIGSCIGAIALLFAIPVLPDIVKVLGMLAILLATLIYMVKNFMVLMAMDITLATLHCKQTARKQFDLRSDRKLSSVEKRFSRFGKGYAPTAIEPKPAALRYRLQPSMTVYCKGTEKVVAVYRTAHLDKNTYQAIVRSALANSKALTGKKKPIFLDKAQKKAPLHRVTVAVIFAEQTESTFAPYLYDAVCRQDGDGDQISFLPCVIDAERRICVFNSERLPYVGFGYPVKNRGIRIIRKAVFGGKLPLKNNPHTMEPMKDVFEEQSLWAFWHDMKKELIQSEKEDKKRYRSMAHGEIRYEDDFLYIKWEDRGLCLHTEKDEEKQTVHVDPISSWDYPKANRIGKKTAAALEKSIALFFAESGYSCVFMSFDD